MAARAGAVNSLGAKALGAEALRGRKGKCCMNLDDGFMALVNGGEGTCVSDLTPDDADTLADRVGAFGIEVKVWELPSGLKELEHAGTGASGTGASGAGASGPKD